MEIDNLFRSGILPGLLMLVFLSGYCLWVCKENKRTLKPFSVRELISSLRESIWEIPLPFIVLGGIYSGYFAVSEAAAVTALYVLIVEVLILREIKIRSLARIMSDSMILVGGVLIILAVSLASTNYMIDTGVPEKLLSYITEVVSDKNHFLVLLLFFLLILGAILDIFSAIVLVVPIIIPIAVQYGINEIHLGIIFLAAMQLGYLTPPVGLNLFIASYRFKKPILDVYKATFPFLVILFITVVIITFLPSLSLVLLPD